MIGQHQLGKVLVVGLPVSRGGLRVPEDLNQAHDSEEPFLVTFVNPNACHISKHKPNYLPALHAFSRVHCDGIGLILAARIRAKLRLPRLAFDTTSLALPVLDWARSRTIPIVLVGGRKGVADNAAKILAEQLPGLSVSATYSGYGDDPTKAKQHIAEHSRAMVVCGMGAPRQEEFLLSLCDMGWTGIGFTCGGFMDQLGERFYYYPAWVDRMNLRFAYRMYKEPTRLGKRYLKDYCTFAKRLLDPRF